MRVVNFILAALVTYLVVVLVWYLYVYLCITPSTWSHAARVCQWLAYRIGHAGMRAELIYDDLVKVYADES